VTYGFISPALTLVSKRYLSTYKFLEPRVATTLINKWSDTPSPGTNFIELFGRNLHQYSCFVWNHADIGVTEYLNCFKIVIPQWIFFSSGLLVFFKFSVNALLLPKQPITRNIMFRKIHFQSVELVSSQGICYPSLHVL